MTRDDLPPVGYTVDEDGKPHFLVRGKGVIGCNVSLEATQDGPVLQVQFPLHRADFITWETLLSVSEKEARSILFRTTDSPRSAEDIHD